MSCGAAWNSPGLSLSFQNSPSPGLALKRAVGSFESAVFPVR